MRKNVFHICDGNLYFPLLALRDVIRSRGSIVKRPEALVQGAFAEWDRAHCRDKSRYFTLCFDSEEIPCSVC